MRWTVHGCPRLWWTERSTFDGISTYKLDRNGRIYEHAIDNMQLRDPPITNPLLYGWNFLSNTVYAPQQQPCPGGPGVRCTAPLVPSRAGLHTGSLKSGQHVPLATQQPPGCSTLAPPHAALTPPRTFCGPTAASGAATHVLTHTTPLRGAGAWFRDHDEEESHTSFPTPAGQQ